MANESLISLLSFKLKPMKVTEKVEDQARDLPCEAFKDLDRRLGLGGLALTDG
jgi:hypothetical protein